MKVNYPDFQIGYLRTLQKSICGNCINYTKRDDCPREHPQVAKWPEATDESCSIFKSRYDQEEIKKILTVQYLSRVN